MKNKEKKLKAIITILTITILILSMQLFLVKKENINSKKQIVKEMSESEQVADLNNQINALNTEHTEYMNYIQTCKTQIATALTNEGVTTSNQATLATMASNISKVVQERTSDATATADDINKGKIAYVKGEKIVGTNRINNFWISDEKDFGGVSLSVDIKSEYPDIYQNLTIDDFLIGTQKVSVYTNGSVSGWNGANIMTKSYNSSTGILTASWNVVLENGTIKYAYDIFAVYKGTIGGK